MVVAGASAGIGEGTALLFARYGCLLTLTGRDEDRLAAVVQKCVATGCPADKVQVFCCKLVGNFVSFIEQLH